MYEYGKYNKGPVGSEKRRVSVIYCIGLISYHLLLLYIGRGASVFVDNT